LTPRFIHGLLAYVILENHMHLIAQRTDLRRLIARFTSYTSKQELAYLTENSVSRVVEQLAFCKKAHKAECSYRFWQEGLVDVCTDW